MTKNRKLKSPRWWQAAVAIAVGAFLVLTSATARASTGPAGPVPGLTTAQAQALQAHVDHYLHKLGGKQIAANEIRLPSGADLLLALPGQKYAHHLTGAAASAPLQRDQAPCPEDAFCAYQDPNYEGSVLSAFCNESLTMPWSTDGSYINSLPFRATPEFLGYYGEILDVACRAYCAVTPYDWAPIYSIETTCNT